MDTIIAFINGAKGISEKHLKPAAISFLGMLCTYYLWDTKKCFFVKLGTTFFMLFFFTAYFLIIELIIWFKDYIIKKEEEKRKKKENLERINREGVERKRKEEEDEKRQLNLLWSYADRLDDDDYNYLMQFINNGNNQIEIKEDYLRKSILFNSGNVHFTILKKSEKIPIQLQKRETTGSMMIMPAVVQYEDSPAIYGFMLTEEAYYWYNLSYTKYGKISNLEKSYRL